MDEQALIERLLETLEEIAEGVGRIADALDADGPVADVEKVLVRGEPVDMTEFD